MRGRKSLPPESSPVMVVQNRQRRFRLDVAALQKFAERALALCLSEDSPKRSSLTAEREIIVVLVSDRRMSELHTRFLGVVGPTDVITFQHGEIFIGVEVAARQAKEFRTSTLREVQLYLIHGLLHLAGLDDSTPKSAREMARTQERLLRRLEK